MRKFQITKALYSTRSLVQTLDELTEEEVLAALELEVESRRRSFVIDKLIHKAGELHRQTYVAKLKEKHKWPAPSPSF